MAHYTDLIKNIENMGNSTINTHFVIEHNGCSYAVDITNLTLQEKIYKYQNK